MMNENQVMSYAKKRQVPADPGKCHFRWERGMKGGYGASFHITRQSFPTSVCGSAALSAALPYLHQSKMGAVDCAFSFWPATVMAIGGHPI